MGVEIGPYQLKAPDTVCSRPWWSALWELVTSQERTLSVTYQHCVICHGRKFLVEKFRTSLSQKTWVRHNCKHYGKTFEDFSVGEKEPLFKWNDLCKAFIFVSTYLRFSLCFFKPFWLSGKNNTLCSTSVLKSMQRWQLKTLLSLRAWNCDIKHKHLLFLAACWVPRILFTHLSGLTRTAPPGIRVWCPWGTPGHISMSVIRAIFTRNMALCQVYTTVFGTLGLRMKGKLDLSKEQTKGLHGLNCVADTPLATCDQILWI